jgi:tetratricopeptide (TPR) repeat protein
LQIALGQALIATRGWGVSEVNDVYARARHLAEKLNRPRELLFALFGQWSYFTIRADFKRARQLAREMRDWSEVRSEVRSDFRARLLSCHASGYTCIHLGEFTVALADMEQGLALFDPADRQFYADVLAYDPLVALLVHLAYCLCFLGHLDRTVSRQDAALAEARRLAHPFTLAVALAFDWFTGWELERDPITLLRYADEFLAVATEQGFAAYQAFALIQRGWCVAALGDADEGIALLGKGLAGLRDSGFMDAMPLALRILSDACRGAGQFQAALGHLAEAQRLGEMQGRGHQSETVRLRGEVLLALGDPAAAEAGYQEAIAIAQQQSAKLWELRAATSLARLWRDQGKRIAARDLLAPVYGWFTEGFDTPVLHEAKALLDELA